MCAIQGRETRTYQQCKCVWSFFHFSRSISKEESHENSWFYSALDFYLIQPFCHFQQLTGRSRVRATHLQNYYAFYWQSISICVTKWCDDFWAGVHFSKLASKFKFGFCVGKFFVIDLVLKTAKHLNNWELLVCACAHVAIQQKNLDAVERAFVGVRLLFGWAYE